MKRVIIYKCRNCGRLEKIESNMNISIREFLVFVADRGKSPLHIKCSCIESGHALCDVVGCEYDQ